MEIIFDVSVIEQFIVVHLTSKYTVLADWQPSEKMTRIIIEWESSVRLLQITWYNRRGKSRHFLLFIIMAGKKKNVAGSEALHDDNPSESDFTCESYWSA